MHTDLYGCLRNACPSNSYSDKARHCIECVKSVSLFKLDKAVCEASSTERNIMRSLKDWHAAGKDILVDVSVTAPCFGEMLYGGCIGQRAGALR